VSGAYLTKPQLSGIYNAASNMAEFLIQHFSIFNRMLIVYLLHSYEIKNNYKLFNVSSGIANAAQLGHNVPRACAVRGFGALRCPQEQR